MSTTCQQIYDRAQARHTLNPGTAATLGSPQVLAWVSAEQRFLYITAARWNPEYFGKTADTATRTAATQSWDLAATPGDVAAVTNVRVAAIVGTVTGVAVNDTVNLVTYRYPDYEVSPRVYLRGRQLYAQGSDLGSGANYVSRLTLDYAELPSTPITLSAALRLPDEWCVLPELRLAMYLAVRDERQTDIQTLAAEYEVQFATFREHMLVLDHGAARPLAAIPALPVPTAASSQ